MFYNLICKSCGFFEIVDYFLFYSVNVLLMDIDVVGF